MSSLSDFPIITSQTIPSPRKILPEDPKVLIITSCKATDKGVNRFIYDFNLNEEEIKTQFTNSSSMYNALFTALKVLPIEQTRRPTISCYAYDETLLNATARVITYTFTNAIADEKITIKVPTFDGAKLKTVVLNIKSTDLANDIAQSFYNLVNGITESAYSFVRNTNVITATHKTVGENDDEIDIQSNIENGIFTQAGFVANTPATTANKFNTTSIITEIQRNGQHIFIATDENCDNQDLIIFLSDNLKLSTNLSRFAGIVYNAQKDTLANIISNADTIYGTFNSIEEKACFSLIAINERAKTINALEVLVASVCTMAKALTFGALNGDIVLSNTQNSKDQIMKGRAGNVVFGFNNYKLNGIPFYRSEDQFSENEKNQLYAKGIATIGTTGDYTTIQSTRTFAGRQTAGVNESVDYFIQEKVINVILATQVYLTTKISTYFENKSMIDDDIDDEPGGFVNKNTIVDRFFIWIKELAARPSQVFNQKSMEYNFAGILSSNAEFLTKVKDVLDESIVIDESTGKLDVATCLRTLTPVLQVNVQHFLNNN